MCTVLLFKGSPYIENHPCASAVDRHEQTVSCRGGGAGGQGGEAIAPPPPPPPMYALGGGLAPPKMTDGIYQIGHSLVK